MTITLDWEKDGKDWPNREASRFVDAGSLRWHVQLAGDGPALLLLHGTGSSTHSWRDMIPALAETFTVVAPDLPGHAFTSRPTRRGLSLPSMAAELAALLATLKLEPRCAVGHSAGSAILARMGVDKLITPEAIVSFNGAFFPMGGAAGQWFSPLAKFVAGSPLMPKIFAAMADDRTVERLIKDTGSTIDARGLALYRRLFSCESHVAGTLGMMSAWDLHWVESDMRRLAIMLYLVKAGGDLSIPPATANRAARLARKSAVITIPGLGHLAHEEKPQLAVDIIKAPENFVERKH